MASELQVKEINEAIAVIDKIFPCLDKAISKLKSARNWGFVDMLGGGFFTDLIKHGKINSAKSSMDKVAALLNDLKRELGDVEFPSDYKMNTGGFATFADFFFDGVLADVYMQGKIFNSIDTMQNLENQLRSLRCDLVNMKR